MSAAQKGASSRPEDLATGSARRPGVSPAAAVLVAPIRFYQRFITPYTPATCRYHPTCSAYAVTALRRRGAVVGSVLTAWRLLRCNPWSDGGIDHVPDQGWPRRGGQPRSDAHGEPRHPVDHQSDSTELTRTATAGSQTTGRPAA